MPQATWAAHATQAVDQAVIVALADGVSVEQGRAAVEKVAAGYGDPDVMTRTEYIDDTTGNIDAALGLIYVLLALAIIIALMGIANTLALAVYERTSELGILRAVGTTRPQVRAMVRWEAVIVAVFGTLSGIAVGVFLGWALFRLANVAGSFDTFAFPTTATRGHRRGRRDRGRARRPAPGPTRRQARRAAGGRGDLSRSAQRTV